MPINKISFLSFLLIILHQHIPVVASSNNIVLHDDEVIIVNESDHPVVVTYNAGNKQKYELLPKTHMTLSRECLLKITHRVVRFIVRKQWIFDGQLNDTIKTITIPDDKNPLIQELLATRYKNIFHNTGAMSRETNLFVNDFLDATLFLHPTAFKEKSFVALMETAQCVIEDRAKEQEQETGLTIDPAKKLALLLTTLEKHIAQYMPYKELKELDHALRSSFDAINGEKNMIRFLTPSHRSKG